MTKKTSVLRASLTGFAGLVGAGVAVVVVAAVCVIPLPGFTATSAALEVVPLAGVQTRVCSGPLLQVVPQVGDTTRYFATGEPTVFSDARDAMPTTRDLSTVDMAASGISAVPFVLSVPPAAKDAAQPLVAGLQSQQVSTEEVAGFAAAACSDATSDSWLVGGATDVGRTTLILLSNPSQVTATVSLEILGENGAVNGPGTSGILVEPGQQRVLSLAAFAPDLVGPVVHVTTTGGLIQASLQQTVIRALVPGGVELVTPSAAPNTTQIMTGIALTGLAAQDQGEKGLVTNDLEPTIRVGVPGADAADVVISVIGEGGATTEIRTTIQGYHTLQLPFTGIPDGIYTVVVTGTKPIVGGVRSVQAASSDVVPLPNMIATGSSPAPSPATSSSPQATAAPTATPASQPTSTPTPSASASATRAPSTPAPMTPAPTTRVPGSAGGGDFSWNSSSAPLNGDTLIPVVDGPNPRLSLYNPTAAPITATLSSAANSDLTIVIAAGTMMTVPLMSTTRYVLAGGASLHAALTYAGVGLGSSIALTPTNQLGAAIRVYPR